MLTVRRLLFVGLAACGMAVAASAAHLPGADGGADAAAGVLMAPDGSRTLEAVMFYIFAGVAAASAVGIAVTRNIVRAAIWLLGTLGGVAGLYFLMAANFLGAIQLIVYVGGTLVLIIFGVMLTARIPGARLPLRRWEIAGGAAVCGLLFVALSLVLLRTPWAGPPLAGSPDQGEGIGEVASIGNALLTTYLVPFEAASVLLLAVMIGAAYLARPEKK